MEIEDCYPPNWNVEIMYPPGRREEELQRVAEQLEAVEQLDAAKEATGGVGVNEYIQWINTDTSTSENVELVDLTSDWIGLDSCQISSSPLFSPLLFKSSASSSQDPASSSA